jgi:hypothetical protein
MIGHDLHASAIESEVASAVVTVVAVGAVLGDELLDGGRL